MIGATSGDLILFGMLFRSSSLYTLSSLFTAVSTNKRPMFSFKVTFETKELSNDEGLKWYVPVCRVASKEDDGNALMMLEDLAKGFETRADDIVNQEDEPPVPDKEDEPPTPMDKDSAPY